MSGLNLRRVFHVRNVIVVREQVKVDYNILARDLASTTFEDLDRLKVG